VFDLKNRILVTSNTIAEYFEEQNGIDKSLRVKEDGIIVLLSYNLNKLIS
jgi:1,4-dihydroxy-2-naphthoate octaprenyltransferase